MGTDRSHGCGRVLLDHIIGDPPWLIAAAVLACTLLPTVFVFLSASNSPTGLRDPHVLVCAALFAGTIWLSYWIGQHNVMPASTWREWVEMIDAQPGADGSDESIAKARALHHISWFWLLLPIILTTAFVIFGAWRRAVRDAEVDAVGGNE